MLSDFVQNRTRCRLGSIFLRCNNIDRHTVASGNSALKFADDSYRLPTANNRVVIENNLSLNRTKSMTVSPWSKRSVNIPRPAVTCYWIHQSSGCHYQSPYLCRWACWQSVCVRCTHTVCTRGIAARGLQANALQAIFHALGYSAYSTCQSLQTQRVIRRMNHNLQLTLRTSSFNDRKVFIRLRFKDINYSQASMHAVGLVNILIFAQAYYHINWIAPVMSCWNITNYIPT